MTRSWWPLTACVLASALALTAGCGSTAGAVVTARDVAAIDMLTPRVGVGVTETSLFSCKLTSPTAGCQSEFAPFPLELVATTDGGHSWRREGVPIPYAQTDKLPFSSMVFVTKRAGYVQVGESLVSTTDAGQHWRTLLTGAGLLTLSVWGSSVWVAECANGPLPTSPCRASLRVGLPGGVLSSPTAVPLTAGQLIGRVGPGVGVFSGLGPTPEVQQPEQFMVTTDAGRSWAPLRVPCGGPVVGFDPGRWWLVCAQDGGMNQGIVRVYATSDSGHNWLEVASANPVGPSPGGLSDSIPQAVAVSADGQRLWIAGLNGIQSSTDGGASWQDVKGVNLGGWRPVFSMLPPEHAWLAVGNQGMWTTADGTTWRAS